MAHALIHNDTYCQQNEHEHVLLSDSGHFQLIIITHDEDFVELLGRSAAIDHYYKVSKSTTDFCSVISKRKMAE